VLIYQVVPGYGLTTIDCSFSLFLSIYCVPAMMGEDTAHSWFSDSVLEFMAMVIDVVLRPMELTCADLSETAWQ